MSEENPSGGREIRGEKKLQGERDGTQELESLRQNIRDMENSPDADAVKDAMVGWGKEHSLPIPDASAISVGAVFEYLVDGYAQQKMAGSKTKQEGDVDDIPETLSDSDAYLVAFGDALLNRISKDLGKDPAKREVARKIAGLVSQPDVKSQFSENAFGQKDREPSDDAEAQRLHVQALEADIRRAMAHKDTLLARLRKNHEKVKLDASKTFMALGPMRKDLEAAKAELVHELKVAGYRDGSSATEEIHPDFHFDDGGELVIDRRPLASTKIPEALMAKMNETLDKKLKTYNEANLAFFRAKLVADAAAAEEEKAYAEIQSTAHREDSRIAKLQETLKEVKMAKVSRSQV